jgi:conjugative transfer signal peptidase TraF
MTDRRERQTIARCGDALRAHAQRQRRRRRWGVAVGVLIAAVVGSIALPPRPLLVWNVSASAPIGLYAIGGRSEISAGDTVLTRVPERWRALAGARRYIPINVPLVKRVAAEPGDAVCALGHEIFVNGRWIAERRERDGAGRPMPLWSGCVTLRRGALFLLMDSPDSFDGRYFGPTERGDVIGKARLIWRC